MNDSEQQFNELVAQVLVRTQKMLTQSDSVTPYGLLLSASSNTEVLLPVDMDNDLGTTLNFIQEQLRAKVKEKEYLATAIVFANYEAMKVEVFLENNENFCLKVNIPVSNQNNQIKLVQEDIDTEDGAIYVFPVNE